jgi:pilus assembly protein CpaE
MKRKIRILIADDSEQMRRNMRRIIELEEGMEIVGEAVNGEEAVRWVNQTRPDIVMMDVQMPILDGIKATEAITAEHPEVGVIIVSVEGDTEHFRSAMIAGARNYLLKPYTSDALIAAIHRLAQRQPLRARSTPEESTIIAIYSPHGGLGKTMLATNLGTALTEEQTDVVVVDLSLQFGNSDVFLDLAPECTWLDVARGADELTASSLEHYLTAHETGLKVLCAPPQPQWADQIPAGTVQRVLTLLREHYRYILLDLSSGINDVTLTALDVADLTMLLITQEVPHLRDVNLFLDMVGAMNYPAEKLRLILNRYQEAVEPGRGEIEKALQQEVLWCIPSQERVVVSAINRGQPFLLTTPHSPIARSIAGLARHLRGTVEQPERVTLRQRLAGWLRPGWRGVPKLQGA